MNLRSREASDLQSDAIDHSAISPLNKIWTLGESNPWPPACKAGALPTKLRAQKNYLATNHEPTLSTGFEALYIPNITNTPNTTTKNPIKTIIILVPPRFLSARAFLPKIPTSWVA